MPDRDKPLARGSSVRYHPDSFFQIIEITPNGGTIDAGAEDTGSFEFGECWHLLSMNFAEPGAALDALEYDMEIEIRLNDGNYHQNASIPGGDAVVSFPARAVMANGNGLEFDEIFAGRPINVNPGDNIIVKFKNTGTVNGITPALQIKAVGGDHRDGLLFDGENFPYFQSVNLGSIAPGAVAFGTLKWDINYTWRYMSLGFAGFERATLAPDVGLNFSVSSGKRLGQSPNFDDVSSRAFFGPTMRVDLKEILGDVLWTPPGSRTVFEVEVENSTAAAVTPIFTFIGHRGDPKPPGSATDFGRIQVLEQQIQMLHRFLVQKFPGDVKSAAAATAVPATT